ncbi:hypothetical protein VNO80_20936 [Phaseolus coccineus]|uniref:Uncharacterized protein n=1 Tax=Phaseolus coccineus TaxID=3886 RepID=A0AAN9M6Y9_PHACN
MSMMIRMTPPLPALHEFSQPKHRIAVDLFPTKRIRLSKQCHFNLDNEIEVTCSVWMEDAVRGFGCILMLFYSVPVLYLWPLCSLAFTSCANGKRGFGF